MDWPSILVAVLTAVVTYLLIGKKADRFRDRLQWESKAREQAVKAAEYLALVFDLKSDDPPEKYERANRLSWELAMWLPEEAYRAVAQGVGYPSADHNVLTAVIEVRRVLLGDRAGVLDEDKLAWHRPGIGAHRVQADEKPAEPTT